MPAQRTAHVTLNDRSIAITPGLSDSIGPHGPAAVTMTVTVALDADDAAAALYCYLNEGGTWREMLSDADAWLTIADTLVNTGLGSTLVGARDEMTLEGDDNPFTALCRDRVARLLSKKQDTARVMVPAQQSRESVAVSR